MDADKIQEFLLHHFEKFLLLVVIGGSGFLVYQGLQHENILDTQQPDRLIADAKQVRAAVDDDHNDVVLEGRKSELDINKEVERRRTPVEPSGYSVVTWEPMDAISSIRRGDPALTTPMAVQVHGVLAPMAVRSTDGLYALADLEPADALEVEVEPERKPRERRSRRGRGGGGDMEMMEAMMMDEMDMEMDGMDGMDDMEDSMAANVGGRRRLANPLGMRPSNTRHIINDTPQPPVPGIGWFIAGTAVMPYKALHEAYKDALAQADEYDPRRRDRPTFTRYEVQRADVTDKSVDQLQDADWVQRDGRTECVKDAVLIWSGFAPEIVPKDYREDATLTMWIPPVMLTDYSTFSLHPLIPMLSKRELEAEAERDALQNLSPEVDEGDIVVGDAGSRSTMSYDEFDMGGDYDMESSRGGGAYGYTQVEVDPPDYKLIRFYDFAIDARDPNAPKLGRKYVYRVRVFLEDPNFPKEPALQPRGSSLAPDAYVRVMGLVSNVEGADDPVEQRKKDSQIATAWSEPSEPVSLPGRDKVYVGPVGERKIRQVNVGNRKVPYETESPKASIVVSQFSTEFRTRMSMLMEEIKEGSVLSKKSEFNDIVDPITLDVKKVPEAEIVSDVTVIDIDGGEPLGIQEGDGLVAPSLMLLYGADGGLQVHEEVDDQEFYRVESFADERGK